MTKKEIFRLYSLERMLENMINTGRGFEDVFISLPTKGSLTFGDMFGAIVYDEILDFLGFNYIDENLALYEKRGLPIGDENSVLSLEELAKKYPFFKTYLETRQEKNG